jgi:hypothetical protein
MEQTHSATCTGSPYHQGPTAQVKKTTPASFWVASLSLSMIVRIMHSHALLHGARRNDGISAIMARHTRESTGLLTITYDACALSSHFQHGSQEHYTRIHRGTWARKESMVSKP